MLPLRKNRSLNDTSIFHCKICDDVIIKPKECFECGSLFCSNCIDPYLRIGKDCPEGCNNCNIKDISAGLKRIYNEIDLKCQYYESCKKMMKITDIEAHQDNCQAPACKMNQICSNQITKNKKFTNQICSAECYIMDILKTTNEQKQLYEKLNKAMNYQQELQPMEWEQKNRAIFMKIMGNRIKSQNAPDYSFVSIATKQGFQNGQHYWQIVESANQSLIKIGVTKTKENIQNISFSDNQTGFAFYALGQLRNGSDCKGKSYAMKPIFGTPIGVYLNMNIGILGFIVNGSYWGPAFISQDLTKGIIYPAIAFLKAVDCIITQKPVPQIIKNYA